MIGLGYGCSGKSGDEAISSSEAVNDVELTLDSCGESVSGDVPDFFANYFACVDNTMDTSDEEYEGGPQGIAING